MVILKPILSLLAASASLQGLALGQTTTKYSQADIDSGKAIQQMSKTAFDNAMKRLPASGPGCTKENVRIRKEWYVLSRENGNVCIVREAHTVANRRNMPGSERTAFRKAVECLMSTPPTYKDVEGAKYVPTSFEKNRGHGLTRKGRRLMTSLCCIIGRRHTCTTL